MRSISLLLACALIPRLSAAADVVKPVDGAGVVVPVDAARALPQLPAAPGLAPALELSVPAAPEPLAADLAAPAPETGGSKGPDARAGLTAAGDGLAPAAAAQDPTLGAQAGARVFDGARKAAVVHFHHDGGETHVHREGYHGDEGGIQPLAKPFPIPGRLRPYLPSSKDQNPQDWSDKITLHLHSIFSDGTMTPEAVIDAAYRKGVRVIALTDHDTQAGVRRAWAKVQEINAAHPEDQLEFHTGVEMSAQGGAHIGALDVDVNNPKLVALLERVRIMRRQKAEAMIANLNGLDEFKEKGIVLTIDEVKAFSQHDAGGTIEIPHIARALVQRGLIARVDDAYDTYLKGDIFKTPSVPPDPTAQEVLEAVHAAGGKAFLNHPYTVRGRTDDEKDRAVEDMLQLGMDGIEVYRPSHATSDNGRRLADERVAKYLLWTEKFGLLAGDGADFHGTDTHLDQLSVWMHNKFAGELLAALKPANRAALASLQADQTMKPGLRKTAPALLTVPIGLHGLAALSWSSGLFLAGALAVLAALWVFFVLARPAPAPVRR